MPLRLVTLDLDDTLWPVDPVLEQAESRFHEFLLSRQPTLFARIDIDSLRAHRLQLLETEPQLRHDISRWRQHSLQQLLIDNGIDEQASSELVREAFAVFLDARHQVSLFDHVEEVLQQLARRYTLIALTNGNADIFRLDIGKHFAHAIRAEQIQASKPEPAMFLKALEIAGCAPGEALHIGDDPHYDIAPARALGMHTLQAGMTGKHPLSDDKSFTSWQGLPALIAERFADN